MSASQADQWWDYEIGRRSYVVCPGCRAEMNRGQFWRAGPAITVCPRCFQGGRMASRFGPWWLGSRVPAPAPGFTPLLPGRTTEVAQQRGR